MEEEEDPNDVNWDHPQKMTPMEYFQTKTPKTNRHR